MATTFLSDKLISRKSVYSVVNVLAFIHLNYVLGLSKAVSFNFPSETETMTWTEAYDKLTSSIIGIVIRPNSVFWFYLI